ncbi:MAG: hypothetical protein HY823_08010 [Acidobacteria bacterium]|nr:hypothetical protein [Acidobacteriota bacterium]
MRRHLALEAIPEQVRTWAQHLGLDLKIRFEDSGDPEMFPNRLVLEGPDAHLFAANRGAALDALQHLLHEAQGEREEARLVYLDAMGQRLFRMREMTAMAEFAARKAQESGSYTFKSLTPRERRWIHLAIARQPGLESVSEGTGTMKSLRVARK